MNTWILVSPICLITIIGANFTIKHYRNNLHHKNSDTGHPGRKKAWRSASAKLENSQLRLQDFYVQF